MEIFIIKHKSVVVVREKTTLIVSYVKKTLRPFEKPSELQWVYTVKRNPTNLGVQSGYGGTLGTIKSTPETSTQLTKGNPAEGIATAKKVWRCCPCHER
jgi:hypothetical protein